MKTELVNIIQYSLQVAMLNYKCPTVLQNLFNVCPSYIKLDFFHHSVFTKIAGLSDKNDNDLESVRQFFLVWWIAQCKNYPENHLKMMLLDKERDWLILTSSVTQLGSIV